MSNKWWDRTGKIRAVVSYTDKDGMPRSYIAYLPINTHHDLVGWMQDFWSAFLDRPKIFRWMARIFMGKYAYRELYGSKESLDKYGWFISDGYCLQNQEYHKDKIPT